MEDLCECQAHLRPSDQGYIEKPRLETNKQTEIRQRVMNSLLHACTEAHTQTHIHTLRTIRKTHRRHGKPSDIFPQS